MMFEDEINLAFETLAERLRSAINQELARKTAAIREDAPAGDRQPVDTPAPPPAVDTASGARVTDAVRSIERARSLTEILDTLVTCARADADQADVWLRRGGRLHQWRAPESGASAEETPTGSLVIPITIAGADVAFLYADVGSDGTANAGPRTTNLEILTRYAARSLEALTAFKTARALTQRPGEAHAADGAAPGDGDAAAAEEDASARRYARLLVSEIKLYHESAVVDGRRDRDLATRLGGEIARARAMFEQRVPPHVRLRADHFHDELVRTLANGDASLLELRSEN